MRFRKTLTFLILVTALVFPLSAWAQQKPVAPGFSPARTYVAASLPRHGGVKPPLRHADLKVSATTAAGTSPGIDGSPAKPFTQEQVSNMVRAGLGDESGAKLIEQRGIDFAPSEDFIQTLKAAGASEAFLKVLRAAKPPEPASAKKPLNQVQVFVLLVGQVPSHRVTMLVQERGIDFEPTDDYLQEVRLAGGEDELISALKSIKVSKPESVDPTLQARQTEVRQHLARAGEFYRGKRYADAEAELHAAVGLAPEDAELHDALGGVLGDKGDWDGEITEEREALRLNPNLAEAHVNFGRALGEKGDWDGSIAEERAALRLDPNFDVAHVNLGRALGAKGDWDGDIAEQREALRLNPKNEFAHANLGAALGGKHEWDGEIAEEHEALRLDPNNVMAHLTLGAALGGKHDWDGEISEDREALRLDPNNEKAHVNLGMALGVKGDWDGEIVEEREAVHLNPNDEKAHVNLGLALGAKRDWDGAIEEFRATLRLNPKNASAHGSLGLVLGIKGDSDEAITEFRQALSLNPNDANAHYGLGLALERKRDRQGALEEYRSAYELDSKNPNYKQHYEQLLQPPSQPGGGMMTDIAGEWNSLTTGVKRRVRLEGGHAYVERVLTEEQSNLGIFQLCDLTERDGRYVGTCKFQWVTRWYDRWHAQWRTRARQLQGQMEFSKYTATRIEGRAQQKGSAEKWSDKDNSNCGERFQVTWQDFVWIRPN